MNQMTQVDYDVLEEELRAMEAEYEIAHKAAAQEEGGKGVDNVNGGDLIVFLRRIEERRDLLENAVIVEEATEDCDDIQIGSKVVVRESVDGNTFDEAKITFEIVGAQGGDGKKKVSYESPIGSALMGKRCDDLAEVHSPGGVFYLKIIDIVQPKNGDKVH